MIFPLAAAALSVVIDGSAVRSYNAPYLRAGHVIAPIDPFVTGVAASIGYSAGSLIVMRGDRFAQVPFADPPDPQHYQSTYVELAPVLRTLGAQVWYDAAQRTLYVQTPRTQLATPTPFNPAVPQVMPSDVFTPSPVTTPRPVITGTPSPRRTPLPAPAPSPLLRMAGRTSNLSKFPIVSDTFEERAKRRRETMTAHVAHSKAQALEVERRRDAGLLPGERAEAIWQLVRDLAAIRGTDGSEFRLDRSVVRVERRRR